ncbi:MAG TPA: HAMP domain-containing sensor histidine kinase [Chloroflexia bacterium]|nr:HAMP domain-containing sensor histidine kinase [Chloroflexia bacterium]
MKLHPKLQATLFFIGLMLGLAVIFTATFFLTGWLYDLAGLTIPAVWKQLINSLGGLFIFGLIITALTRTFRSRMLAGERLIYGPIIDALERIAKGDFSVSVENKVDRNENRMIGELVDSVNRMAAELNQLETMRQEFISNVSHEIQTPLTSIHGFTQALQSETLALEDRQHYLTIIEAESTRLSRLSDNLLKLASLEAEQMKYEPKPYRLDRQLRHLILACEPQWLSKALEMDIALAEVTVIADEDLLNQVWLNLLHNSIKFTPHGGKICIGLSQNSDKIEFKIADTGIGISEEDQAHIFERFYKADKSRTGLAGGSGLGLSITKKIVELHKGTIAVESQLEQGTIFRVSLPVR